MPNLLEMLPKIVSGQMGLDEICKSFGISKTELPAGEPRGLAFDRLLSDAVLDGVQVHEAVGTLKGVPVRCIVVAKGKLL
jgi:hypothetical protein